MLFVGTAVLCDPLIAIRSDAMDSLTVVVVLQQDALFADEQLLVFNPASRKNPTRTGKRSLKISTAGIVNDGPGEST